MSRLPPLKELGPATMCVRLPTCTSHNDSPCVELGACLLRDSLDVVEAAILHDLPLSSRARLKNLLTTSDFEKEAVPTTDRRYRR